ncbi:DUF4249 family protein [Flavobacterium sp. W1B]|uniref:DUF4249 family protein n=1 Tax=Flavobacterium sp. W1B TaxID=3394146 RepID=UPI0039BD7F85
MKKIAYCFVILIAFLLNSCEEVVQVNLDTAPPKLVIEASINWKKGTTGNNQKIKLTTTTDFYNPIIPKVSGAIIYIKNSSNQTFTFLEIPKTGEYICSSFLPMLNETYKLTVIHNGNTYTATETLKSVAPITKIVQNDAGGITGKDIEIKTYFNDPANESNYYFYKYAYSDQLKSNYYAADDALFQGNEFFSKSQNDEIKSGDLIEITHYGVSKTYYNYLKVLVSIAGSNSGGPFQSPPATVRGNIINTTDFANYPLGYFSLSEVDVRSYTVK